MKRLLSMLISIALMATSVLCVDFFRRSGR
jgi:hypothetical protein